MSEMLLDIMTLTARELTEVKLNEIISKKGSFTLIGVKDVSIAVRRIEAAIEKQNLRCRVYTEYRSAVLAGMAIPTGITQVAGFATAAGIAAHNLVTINPDYEIGKNKVSNSLTVIFKK
ncbi:MAG: hypothetical protein RBR82_03930 [Pseudomonas sp.]|nr:hypothetical protein [Pseudomonas sp.]